MFTVLRWVGETSYLCCCQIAALKHVCCKCQLSLWSADPKLQQPARSLICDKGKTYWCICSHCTITCCWEENNQQKNIFNSGRWKLELPLFVCFCFPESVAPESWPARFTASPLSNFIESFCRRWTLFWGRFPWGPFDPLSFLFAGALPADWCVHRSWLYWHHSCCMSRVLLQVWMQQSEPLSEWASMWEQRSTSFMRWAVPV